MAAFGARELDMLADVLRVAWKKAESRRLPVTREKIARRLFDAAVAGIKDPPALVEIALGQADGDGPFSPNLGMRPLPKSLPSWETRSLAA